MRALKRIWHLAGNIHLTLMIIGLMIVDLVWGYGMLKTHNELFQPLNDLGFLKWSATWAKESFVQSLWLFILVGLIALLAVNTFVCTTERVIVLVRFRSRFKSRLRFFLRFGPHIMHYALLIMFTGYLFSYLYAGTHLGKVLVEGKSIRMGQTKITLKNIKIDYFKGTGTSHLENRAIHVRGDLVFEKKTKKGTAVLSFNHPAIFKGLSLHLRDFGPKLKKSSMGLERRYLEVTVKKDPGIGFYFAGMACFVFGLFVYIAEKVFAKRPAKESERAGMEVK